jgi:hypothetical protein
MDDEVSPVVYTLARKAWANARGFFKILRFPRFVCVRDVRYMCCKSKVA